VFSGTMITPGIAIGPAVVWAPAGEPVLRPQALAASVPAERLRLEQALRRVRRELEETARRVAVTVGESAAAIFAAHLQFLHDPGFIAPILRQIEVEHQAAESAVDVTVEAIARRFAAHGNSYLAARAQDLIELGNRLLAHLREEGPQPVPRLPGPCVLIAEELAAADVIALDRRHLLGLVMVRSGATSHAALLASTLGVPVVGGVPQLSGQVRDGDTVIVDGNHGHVLVNPAALTLREYRIRREIFDRFCGELAGLRAAPAVTPDGRVVRLSANVSLAKEIPHVLAQGAEGIGLVRTEYFYLDPAHRDPPGEEEQYRFYAEVVRAMAPHRVTFRAFDLGGDKATATPVAPEANPMLGCRGIRLLLECRELFVSQLRALLRASQHGPIRIMFPLVISLTEFQDTMLLVRQVERQLRAQGVPFDEHVPFGCMIETPAAATIPDILATEAEFFSIGTNDLIQYTLAADRSNPRVAHLYEPLHLAVLRMMRAILRAAHRWSRPVSVCGEMAADPIYTLILLGLGVDELSMNPVMIPAIKQIIRGVTWAEARDVARGVLRERRAKDVEAYLEQMMARRFPQVMSMYGPEEPAEVPAPEPPSPDVAAR
jgi:phosphoenolpyruvate-protein phosphotransferase (PTS system enzyme I)